jgi:hypothetical protein
MSAPKTQPVILGGLVMGLLSALPIVSAGNLCCCLWVLAGGVVAAYVLQQNDPQPVSPGDGALVGFLAGILGAFVYLILSIPITLLVTPIERAILQRLADTASTMPPQFKRYMESSLAVTGLRIALGFIVMLFGGALFSTLGGVIGVAVFGKKAAVVAPPVLPRTPQDAGREGGLDGVD